jgi:hypothetical protein
MATVAHLGTAVINTTAGSKTVTATPTANDLVVVFTPITGLTGSGPTISVTDDNSDGQGSYTMIGVTPNRTGFSTLGALQVWVRNSLVGISNSTIFTANQTGSSGGGLDLFRVSGMSRAGSSAVRQSTGQSSGTAGTTPAPAFGSAVLTGNPVLAAVGNGTSPATLTPRGSPVYTEATDVGYSTPTTGFESMFISSGETGTTITWGSTSATSFASIAIELDSSAPSTVFNIPGVLGAYPSPPEGLFPGLGEYF